MLGLKKSPLHSLSEHNIFSTKFSVDARTNPFDSDHELDTKQIHKSSGRMSKHKATDTKFSVNARTNPFDSDDELDNRLTVKDSGTKHSEPSLFSPDLSTNPFDDHGAKHVLPSQTNRAPATKNRCKNVSEPSLSSPDLSTNPFDDNGVKDTVPSQTYHALATKNRYKNAFGDAGWLENQNVEELKNYAVYKAEETTNSVNNCLKIAEDMRESGTRTLVILHQQGEHLKSTHMIAANMDQELSRGEKLLGSLGGIFSKTWKPKKTRPISGPITIRDNPVHRKGNHLEQRERLGLTSYASNEQGHTQSPPTNPRNALQKVEAEKVMQDDALSDLSNILGDLKEIALDMGSEIDRQNNAMDRFQDDVDELNLRVKGANQRTRRLLGK